MVGAVFDGFRAFQTACKAFQDETNQLFVVKKSKSVKDAVNKKLYNSVILLYLTILNNFLLRRHTHQTIECAPLCGHNKIEPYLNYLNK